MASISHREFIHLGLDVHKDTISAAVLEPDREVPAVDKIAHDEASVRRLIARLGEPSRLWACYEAGPTGYDLHRLLVSMGVRCEVIAPSLIPKVSGDRVKTDKRDAARLARLHRAGELTPIRVPSPAEEGVRDVCRARQAAIDSRRRARQQLGSFLLRHSRVWRDGANWTMKHHQWVSAQRFDEPATQAAFGFYVAEVVAREATVDAMEAELAVWFGRAPFADTVSRLACYRGIDRVGALGLATEVCDWRRFPTATVFMGFAGLVPCEYSSGNTVRRGHLTLAGNAHVRTQLAGFVWAEMNA